MRCPECNTKAGGKPTSAHLKGLAVDIDIFCSNDIYRLLKEAYKRDFNRIGIKFEKKDSNGKIIVDGFLHLDIDTTLPQEVIWAY